MKTPRTLITIAVLSTVAQPGALARFQGSLHQEDQPKNQTRSLQENDWTDGCFDINNGPPRQRLYRNQYACLRKYSGWYYGIGLDENGVLRERRSSDNYQGGVWSSGASGTFATWQWDGNFVLYDGIGKPVWATNCRSSRASLLVIDDDFEHGYPVMKIWTNETTWRIYPGGIESRCNPTGAPKVTCKGQVLKPGEKLQRNEYICSPDGKTRFGLDDHNRLILTHTVGRTANVWSPGFKVTGDRLVMQKSDGNLVLYDRNNKATWASGCNKPGAGVYISDVRLDVKIGEAGQIISFLEYDGNSDWKCVKDEESEDPCSTVSILGSTCRMHFIDHGCRDYISAELKDVGDHKFSYAVGEQSFCYKNYSNVRILEGENNSILPYSCNAIISWSIEDFYFLNDKGDKLQILTDSRYPCTLFGRNLIYDMIDEYWYD